MAAAPWAAADAHPIREFAPQPATAPLLADESSACAEPQPLEPHQPLEPRRTPRRTDACSSYQTLESCQTLEPQRANAPQRAVEPHRVVGRQRAVAPRPAPRRVHLLWLRLCRRHRPARPFHGTYFGRIRGAIHGSPTPRDRNSTAPAPRPTPLARPQMGVTSFALRIEHGGGVLARLQFRRDRTQARAGCLQLRFRGFCANFERGHDFRLFLLERSELGIALDERVPNLRDRLIARGKRIAHRAQFGPVSLRLPLRLLSLGKGRFLQCNFLGQCSRRVLGPCFVPLASRPGPPPTPP